MSKKKKDKTQIFETVKNMEIFKVGTTRDGRKITQSWISKIIENTRKAIADGFTPKATVGNHHFEGSLAGSLQNIHKLGNSIVSDLKLTSDAKDRLYKNKKSLDTRSIELGSNFHLANGEKINDVITGMAIGVLNPAQHNLSSMFEVSSDNRKIESFEVLGMNREKNENKEKDMAENMTELVAKVESLLTENIGLKNELKTANSKIKGLESNTETFTVDEKKALEKELTDYKTQVETFETNKKTAIIEGFKKDGTLLPADEMFAIETFEALIEKSGLDKATDAMNKLYSKSKAPNTENFEVGNAKTERSTEIDPTDHSQMNRKEEAKNG